MNKLLSIKEVAEILHASQNSLRSWEKEGKLSPIYTVGGHRRYKEEDIEKILGIEKEEPKKTNRCAIYARVSTGEQKTHGDLERQVGRLTKEAVKRKYIIVEVITEVASGMNDKRQKLHKMMDLVIEKKIDVVLIEHKDRLTRFMFDYLTKFFISYGVRIEWTEDVLGKTYEQELVEDILSLMASFSAKIYSRRAAKNRKNKKDKDKV
ncbi:MAG: IS607 family transposase [Nanoarchaeota archaeon]